ncbi:hypothetical protein Tco_1217542 [Tanacetum coccineum]
MRSPRVPRQREMVVGLEEAPNREGGMIERNVEGGGPSELGARENGSQGMSLPPLLAAHLERSENGQALQSSLTSVYGGHQPSINIGGNLPPNGTHLSHNAQPFIPSSSHHPMDSYLLMLTLTPNHLWVLSMGKLRITLPKLKMVTSLSGEPTLITHKKDMYPRPLQIAICL